MDVSGWLLFLYALPSRHNRQRVNLWRKLKKFGALPLKTSACLLPDTPVHYERLQWLAKQLNDEGGEATLVRAKEIEGMSQPQVIALFNDARAGDYAALIQDLNALLKANRRRVGKTFEASLERLRSRHAEIQEVDFFGSPRAQDVVMLFQKAERLTNKPEATAPVLKKSAFQNKTWLTRPRPEIDRVGSAWLIKTFIDPQARFVFGAGAREHPEAIPYDMADVELTHQGDDCTFETLIKRFALKEKALQRMAEMVHDTDLGDGKFNAPGAEGIHRVLKGLAHLDWRDDRILQHGFICFDALHAEIKKG